MKFKLIFDIDNAVFDEGNRDDEIANVLRRVAFDVEAGEIGAKTLGVRDTNGNTIGSAMITGRK